MWEAIDAQVPRAELVTATSTVADLASEVDRDDAMLAQLVDRHLTARRFLPRLIDTVTFEATPAGAEILAAVEGLAGLWARKKVSAPTSPSGSCRRRGDDWSCPNRARSTGGSTRCG